MKTTTKKKPEIAYLLDSNLSLAGKGETRTAKEWKRVYGYEVGLVPGAKFIDAAKLPVKEPSSTAAAIAPKENFTLAEMRGYLEDLYCETAGGYNDYGKNASDYDKAAVKDVQLFLEARGLAEKPEIEKKAIALKKELESFGKVEQCEVTDRDEFNRESATMFHVKITDGFNGGATNTFACMGVVLKAVGAEFPYIHKQETDYGIFHLILKK